jgi:hypothetical protein
MRNALKHVLKSAARLLLAAAVFALPGGDAFACPLLKKIKERRHHTQAAPAAGACGTSAARHAAPAGIVDPDWRRAFPNWPLTAIGPVGGVQGSPCPCLASAQGCQCKGRVACGYAGCPNADGWRVAPTFGRPAAASGCAGGNCPAPPRSGFFRR